jgi:hypothetical protein
LYSRSWPYAFFFSAAACFAQEKMIAVVNNDVITQKDYETFLNFTRMQLSQELLGDKLESKIASIRKDLLQRLIEDKLLIQEAKRMKSRSAMRVLKGGSGRSRTVTVPRANSRRIFRPRA